MAISGQIRNRAHELRDYTAKNLSKLIQMKSYSSQEENVCRLIVDLCKEAGFDEVKVDRLGSVVGRVGYGPRTIAFDAHIDICRRGIWLLIRRVVPLR